MEGDILNVITVYIETRDYEWFDLVSKYTKNNHDLELVLHRYDEKEYLLDKLLNEELEIDMQEKLKEVDLYIIESSLNERMEKVEQSRVLAGVPILFLTDDPESDASKNLLFKYLTADQLVRKIMSTIQGGVTDERTEHIIIASGYETKLSKELSSEYVVSLSEENKKTLIISLSRNDSLKFWNSENVPDPYGRFIYYASESEEKVRLNLESLIFKHREGYNWIPKPYPFDASQWTEDISRNVLEALDKQADYDIVIWHIGSVFSLKFGELFKRARQIIWMSEYPISEIDTAFSMFGDMSARRIDLKTYHIHGAQIENAAPELSQVVRKAMQELKLQLEN